MAHNLQPGDKFQDLTFGSMERLYKFAYARLGSQEDAEDIVQETYLKAYRSFSTFKPGANVQTWLNQILINTLNDHFRRCARTVPTSTLDDSEDICEQQIGPEQQLCEEELDPVLLTALRNLPESLFNTLLLRELGGASYEEIAAVAQIPVGTVMSRLFRARKMLREQLQPILFPAGNDPDGSNKRGPKNAVR